MTISRLCAKRGHRLGLPRRRVAHLSTETWTWVEQTCWCGENYYNALLQRQPWPLS